MPPEKDERAALVDMLEFCREVCSFVEGRTRQDLDADRTLLRALERTLEPVGECARRIPEDTRVAHPSIPWRAMVGMRNIIAHDYGRVNLDLIWRTVQRDMPPVVTALELVVAALPPPQ
ncbi:MAG: HepT-like ribonuclease domain-containing protein [Acidobacteriota bacterium]|mgnify:CR=1 FL=1